MKKNFYNNNNKLVLIGETMDGVSVYDCYSSHLRVEVDPLRDALGVISFKGTTYAAYTVEMNYVVGVSNVVEVGAEDDVEYLYRKGRTGKTPIVWGRTGTLETTITFYLKRMDEGAAVLITAYAGVRVPREPWDRNITDEHELCESKEFWSNHAIIGQTYEIDGKRSFECGYRKKDKKIYDNCYFSFYEEDPNCILGKGFEDYPVDIYFISEFEKGYEGYKSWGEMNGCYIEFSHKKGVLGCSIRCLDESKSEKQKRYTESKLAERICSDMEHVLKYVVETLDYCNAKDGFQTLVALTDQNNYSKVF